MILFCTCRLLSLWLHLHLFELNQTNVDKIWSSVKTNKQHINKLVSLSTITLTRNHILNYFFSCVVTTQNCNKLAYHASSCLRWGKQQRKIHGLSYLELVEDLKKWIYFCQKMLHWWNPFYCLELFHQFIQNIDKVEFLEASLFFVSCLKCCSRVFRL